MKRFALFLSLILGCFYVGFSQSNFPIGIDTAYTTTVSGPVAPIVLDSPFVYNVIFRNISPNTSFSGTIDLGIQINSNFIVKDTLPNDSSVTLQPNDTTFGQFNDTATAARYGGGGGGSITVVIWPAMRNALPSTPVQDSFTIKNLIILAEVEDKSYSRLNLYPNPIEKTLFIYSELEHKDFEQVRLWDSQGQTIQQYESLPSHIHFHQLPAGLYFLSFVTKRGKLITYKILKR